MLKNVKTELHRAFCSTEFAISLSLGLILCFWYFAQYTLPFITDDKLMQMHLQSGFPATVFNQWLGSGFRTIQQYLYFLLIPIIATLPAGTSFNDDITSGIIKNILVRCNRKAYFISKLLSVLLTAGCAVTIPLIVNLLLTCAIVPAVIPVASTGMFSIFATSMWAELFYTRPWIYTFAYIVIIFVFSGLIAQIGLCLSFYFKNKIVIMFAPFLLYMFSYTFFSMIGEPQLSPFCFLPLSQPTYNISFTVIAFEAIVLLLCSIVFFVRKGIKEDVL